MLQCSHPYTLYKYICCIYFCISCPSKTQPNSNTVFRLTTIFWLLFFQPVSRLNTANVYPTMLIWHANHHDKNILQCDQTSDICFSFSSCCRVWLCFCYLIKCSCSPVTPPIQLFFCFSVTAADSHITGMWKRIWLLGSPQMTQLLLSPSRPRKPEVWSAPHNSTVLNVHIVQDLVLSLPFDFVF